MTDSDLNVARSLTWRYAIALLLVASLSTAAWLSLHLVISEQQSTAAVVNISGRQRILSQRTALFSNLLANSPAKERAAIRSKLLESLQLMERSHRSLTHGDETMGLPANMPASVHALYFGGEEPLDGQVQSYINAVHTLSSLDDETLTNNNATLQYITRTASTTLLKSLDNMVRQYQIEGETSIRQLQNAETLFWLITLILLILEAALIFHPFAKHVRHIIGKLQDATAKLQQHHDQLEATVLQRTAELESRSRSLEESEEKFRLISTNAKDGIVIIDNHEKVMYWNPAAEKIFGHTANEAVGRNLHDLLTPERYRKAAHKGFERFRRYGVGELIGKTFDITALHKSGNEFPIALSISAFMLQNSWHALGIVRDITERKQMEEQVYKMAFYDTLTQLPNRRLFIDRLSHAIATNRRSRNYGAVLFLDLDNFKPVNDTHGHKAGDMLLTEAARRLKLCARETDTVARFGGDEFVAILTELDSDKTESARLANLVAEKIRDALSTPYQLDIEDGTQIEHCCTASIGISLFCDHEQDDILKHADTAMYQAKVAGRNQICFYESPD